MLVFEGAQQGPPSCRRTFHIHQVVGPRCLPWPMVGPLRGQGESGSVHPFKAPPRHLGPGRRWPTALHHRPLDNDNGAKAPTAPTATHPGSNPPELNATQKWWAAFVGDRAFARARLWLLPGRGEERNRGRPRPRQSRGRHRPQPSSRIQGLDEHNPAAQGKISMPACWIAFCLGR